MFFAGVLVVLVPIGLSEAFLLSNTSSNGIGTNEFQYLSQMIFSGEQSRHYVENEVTTLDQRVTRLEQDLRTKYVQALNLKDFEYEQKLLNITGFVEKIMNNTKIGFEKKLNETQLALERQIQIGKNLQRAFDKEMTNRLQLEQHYTELMIDFQNVSAARNADIAEIRRNSNSTLNGIKSLDLELKSIGASVDKNMAEIAMINTSILNFESSAVHSVSSFLIVNQTLSAVSSRLQNISMGLSTCRADIKQLKQANGTLHINYIISFQY